MHFHTGAGRCGTADAAAVFGEYQVAGAGRRSGDRDFELQCRGSVAAWVGLHQAQLLARLSGWGEVDQEGAVGTHDTRADHGAIGIANFDGGAGLAATAQSRAT
ncbi:hypothetical protein D3C75_882670 [compost metagenome]